MLFQIILSQVVSVAPTWLTVIGFQYLKHILALLRSFLAHHVNEIVLCRCHHCTTFRQLISQYFLLASLWIHHNQFSSMLTISEIIILHRTRHPLPILLTVCNHPACRQFGNSCKIVCLSTRLRVTITSNQIFSISRK